MAIDARNMLGQNQSNQDILNQEKIQNQSIYLNSEQEIHLRQKLCKYIDELKIQNNIHNKYTAQSIENNSEFEFESISIKPIEVSIKKTCVPILK